MNKIKLFIFDMDGLLVDSCKLSYKAYLMAAKKYDFEITKEIYYILAGQTEKSIRKNLKLIYGDNLPTDKWRDDINKFKNVIYKDEKGVALKKGAIEILEFAKNVGIKVVLATSNSKFRVEEFLKDNDIYDFFDYIITGDEIKIGKPNPEIFLLSCEVVNISREEAIVFEDSIVGVQAANNAGIKVVHIEDKLDGLRDYLGKHRIMNYLTSYRKKLNVDFKFSDLIEAKNALYTRFFDDGNKNITI